MRITLWIHFHRRIRRNSDSVAAPHGARNGYSHKAIFARTRIRNAHARIQNTASVKFWRTEISGFQESCSHNGDLEMRKNASINSFVLPLSLSLAITTVLGGHALCVCFIHATYLLKTGESLAGFVFNTNGTASTLRVDSPHLRPLKWHRARERGLWVSNRQIDASLDSHALILSGKMRIGRCHTDAKTLQSHICTHGSGRLGRSSTAVAPKVGIFRNESKSRTNSLVNSVALNETGKSGAKHNRLLERHQQNSPV